MSDDGRQVALRPVTNGTGKLRAGNLGAVGGGVVPPSVVRARARQSFHDRIPNLERLADQQGFNCEDCGHRTAVCADCGHQQGGRRVEPKDVIRAIDTLGRYGLMTGRLDIEEVKVRLGRTIGKIEELCPPEVAELLLKAIDPIWNPGKQ